ncbi:MAG: imelysin family protein [bacterium]|nr:imelysin family protein [bacterium]
MRRVWAVAAAAVLLGACGGGMPSRSDVLGDLADDYIVPAYQQFHRDAVALADSLSALCASPSSGLLSDARNALSAVRNSWSRAQAVWVGPVMERRSWGSVRWPVADDEIEALIADASIELDHERLSSRIGAAQRGIGAVDYLVGSGEQALGALGGSRRCRYLEGVAAVIAAEAALLEADWALGWEGGEPYRDAFPDADRGDLDRVVNDTLFLLERITDLELGNALGIMSADADPLAVDEGPAGAGVDDLEQRLIGIQAVLIGVGDDPAGLSPLLGDDLTDRLAGQFEAAFDAVGAVGPPLRHAVADAPQTVIEAREAIKAIQITVATEVVSRLGVVIGFSDADGDSSG